MRTSDLYRSIPQITERMLIRHLNDLVRDGIVAKQKAGRQVSYSISEYGMTLVPVMEAICTWGRLHLQRLSGVAVSSEHDEVAGR
jgi:DNA-binding HxlR family transcriptional regulator